MDYLQNILNLDQYTALMNEGKKHPHSSIAGWRELVIQVKTWVLEDRTTSRDNLREKIENYALNYLQVNPGLFPMDKKKLIEDLADEVEKALKNVCFDQRPPASVVAQKARKVASNRPEDKLIKLR